MNTASTFDCFGLVIHGYDLPYTLTEIRTRAAQDQATWIVTANPEILLHAKRHPDYWEILRQADLRLVDGKGLQFAGWYKGTRPRRLTGVDLAGSLAKLCQENRWTMALVGGEKRDSADKAAWHLRRKYPDLMVFSEHGGKVSSDGVLDGDADAALTRLAEIEPDVVLVALGHPKQDFWISRYRSRLPKTKVFMGVGGTIHYWADEVRRAPRWLRTIGFEWLWRLFMEPWRRKRIWNAVVLFPLAVLRDKR